MPFLPYDIRDPNTGLFPENVPLGPELNDAIATVCPLYGNLEQWQRNALADLPGIGGGAGPRLLLGRNLWDELCEPHGGLPPLPPAGPQVPTFPTNCATQGTVDFQTNVGQTIENPTWVAGQDIWNCGNNVGIPVGQPVWSNLGGSTWGYVQTFQRADNSGTVQRIFGQTTFGDVPQRVVIDNISISYCPGCNIPDPPEPPPGVPRTVPPDPPTPQVPIQFSFPQLPGLPDLSFPITYGPTIDLNTPINLQPALTLAPNVELAPEFGFAPTFEFNFGGVSIGGGGYAEPRQEAAELADCDCPDPCPPGGDVDYARIQNSLINVLATRWRFPQSGVNFTTGPWSPYFEAVRLAIVPFGVRVDYELDLTEYIGGGTPTVNGVEGIGYYGWYLLQSGSTINTGTDRKYITSAAASIELPPQTTSVAFYTQNGAKIRVRQVSYDSIPLPPES